MAMRNHALAVTLLFPVAIACSRAQPPAPAPADAGVTTAAPAASSAAPALSFDPPKTQKQTTNGLRATLMGASAGPNEDKRSSFLVISFALDSETDEERPISALSVQVTDGAGVPAALDHVKSTCTGVVPPRGRLACLLKYDFALAEPPDEVRARVEGAWFRVKPEQRVRDAGAK